MIRQPQATDPGRMDAGGLRGVGRSVRQRLMDMLHRPRSELGLQRAAREDGHLQILLAICGAFGGVHEAARDTRRE